MPALAVDVTFPGTAEEIPAIVVPFSGGHVSLLVDDGQYVTVETVTVAIALPSSVASSGEGPLGCGTTVASHAGNGVIKVSEAVKEALLAVNVTSNPSVTVKKTVGYTDPV